MAKRKKLTWWQKHWDEVAFAIATIVFIIWLISMVKA